MTNRLHVHERLLACLGSVLALALVARAGLSPEARWMASATLAFILGVVLLGRLDRVSHAFRVRALLAYAFTFFLYASPKWAVPALGLATRDDWLAHADGVLFGEVPAIALQRMGSPPVYELLSACYLGFHLYLHGAMLWALMGPRQRVERFFAEVFGAYPAGLAGYYLMPAVGPAAAFPERFHSEITGGFLTRMNAALVDSGSSVYDLFPSLHLYITLVLLAHDQVAHPTRFRWMLPLAVGIAASTLVLRYHYAVDLLAGALLFVAYRAAFRASAGTAPAAKATVG